VQREVLDQILRRRAIVEVSLGESAELHVPLAEQRLERASVAHAKTLDDVRTDFGRL